MTCEGDPAHSCSKLAEWHYAVQYEQLCQYASNLCISHIFEVELPCRLTYKAYPECKCMT